MKRFTKIATIFFVIAIAAMMLTACDFNWEDFGNKLKDAIENTPFPYSDTGETEIQLNFAGFKQDTYKGINEWDITYTEGETTKTANLVSYIDNSGAMKKSKFVFTMDAQTLIVITAKDTSVAPAVTTTTYINETAKTISDSMTEEFTDVVGAIMAIGTYGVVTLTSEDDSLANWTFNTKREATIKDKDGSDLEVVQFEYDAARSSGSYSNGKMFVNFKKYGITPVVRNLKYEFYDNETLARTFNFYITLHTDETPTDADFALPQDGYTIL